MVGLLIPDDLDLMYVLASDRETVRQTVARLVKDFDPCDSQVKITFDRYVYDHAVLCVTNRKQVGWDCVIRDELPGEEVHNQLGLMEEVPVWEYTHQTAKVYFGTQFVTVSGRASGDWFDLGMQFAPHWNAALLRHEDSPEDYVTTGVLTNGREGDRPALIVGGRSIWYPESLGAGCRSWAYVMEVVDTQDVAVKLSFDQVKHASDLVEDAKVSGWLVVQPKTRSLFENVSLFQDLDIPGEIPYREDFCFSRTIKMTHSITCFPDDTDAGSTTAVIHLEPLNRLVVKYPGRTIVWRVPVDGFRLDELIQISYCLSRSILWLAHQISLPEYNGVAGSVAANLAKAFRNAGHR